MPLAPPHSSHAQGYIEVRKGLPCGDYLLVDGADGTQVTICVMRRPAPPAATSAAVAASADAAARAVTVGKAEEVGEGPVKLE